MGVVGASIRVAKRGVAGGIRGAEISGRSNEKSVLGQSWMSRQVIGDHG